MAATAQSQGARRRRHRRASRRRWPFTRELIDRTIADARRAGVQSVVLADYEEHVSLKFILSPEVARPSRPAAAGKARRREREPAPPAPPPPRAAAAADGLNARQRKSKARAADDTLYEQRRAKREARALVTLEPQRAAPAVVQPPPAPREITAAWWAGYAAAIERARVVIPVERAHAAAKAVAAERARAGTIAVAPAAASSPAPRLKLTEMEWDAEDGEDAEGDAPRCGGDGVSAEEGKVMRTKYRGVAAGAVDGVPPALS